MTEDMKLDWNDQLADVPQEEFVVLKPGQYHFKVTNFTRQEWPAGTKFEGFKYAEITLRFTNAEGDESTGKDKLTLHPKCLWRIRAFFRAIGCKVEHGQPYTPEWNRVLGGEGECMVKISTWTSTRDGKKYVNNDVEKYLEPAEEDDGALPF